MGQRLELTISCVNDTRKAIQEIRSSFQSLAVEFAAWNYSFQAAFSGVKKVLEAVVLSTVRVGDELYKTSQKTGMSVEELYRLKSVAESSDVSLGEMSLSLGALSRNLFAAKEKAGDARAIFDSLGIDTAQPLGKVFDDLARRFSEIRDGEDKMALAMQLFGRSGQNIIPVLHEVARGGHDIASAFSEESAQTANTFSDNITTLQRGLSELAHTVGNELIPPLNTLFDVLNSKAVERLTPILNALASIGLVSKGIDKTLDVFVGKKIPEVNQAIEPGERRTPAPKITTAQELKQAADDRRKWMEWEWQYADAVDKAGQEILDNLEKQDQATREHTRTLQAARESEIQLQLKEIDLSAQEFGISKAGAIQRRVELYEELKNIQEAYMGNLDKEKDPSSWYAQMNAITETREALINLNLELKKQTDTFAEGAKYGFQEYLYNAKTAFEYGTDMAQASASAMEGFFASISFDAMQGKLKSLGDYFMDFATSIQRAMSQILSQLMVQGIIGGLSGAFAPGVSGAGGPIMVHSGGYIPRFHVGGLASDEVPAILQRGEYVVSKKGVEMLDRINDGRSPGNKDAVIVQQTIQINTSTIDGRDTERFFRENEGRIQKIVGDGVDKSRAYAAQLRGSR